ncbi:MAG: lysophospholipid acyltransferase family protein [Candidatus Omnitrophica bacterium]|nr:lysophospholipid acyltransferase family protein [Candidatus Omnitrophota bacterium]
MCMRLPVKFTYNIAMLFADLTFFFSSKDRRAVYQNLRIIMGQDASAEQIRKASREVFRNFAKYLVDFFRFTKIDEEVIKKTVTVKGAENIEEAVLRNKGVIFLSAHIGNWELAGSVISSLGYPLCAVALKHQNKKINDFFNRQRGSAKVRSIEIGASLKTCYHVLKQSGFLGLLGDRDFTRTGVPTQFFGRTALLPKGPAVFSYRLNAAIVPAYLIRNKDDSFTFFIEKPIIPESYSSEDEAVDDLMKKSAASIERYVGLYPSQWFAFRNIWEEYEKKDMRPHTVI